jgi:UDP-glucose 4-epimerase
MKQVFRASNPITFIGTRHGEKAFETLLTREEMLRAEDKGNYYQVTADTRDLNYNAFFTEGSSQLAALADYNSDNTHRLSRDEMVGMLHKLDYVQQELATSGPALIGEQ